MTEASSKPFYPQRDKFYAQKYARLLAKICLANELGADACYFLTTIAGLEDAKRYSGPINFYNTQLMPIIGQSREETFRKVRAKLMAAGWLYCEIPPHGARQAAIYWTTKPDQYSDIEAGSLDEDSSEYERGHGDGFKFAIDHLTERANSTELCDIHLNTTQKRTLKRCRSDVEAHIEAMLKRTTSLPIPNPVPNPIKSGASPDVTLDEFRLNGAGDKLPKQSKKPFAAPTVEMVQAYCTERKNKVDPESFVAHYTANGWTQRGGAKIKDWKASVITWEKNQDTFQGSTSAVSANRGRKSLAGGAGQGYDPDAAVKNPNHGAGLK